MHIEQELTTWKIAAGFFLVIGFVAGLAIGMDNTQSIMDKAVMSEYIEVDDLVYQCTPMDPHIILEDGK